jgi:hypothetical protein
MKNASKLFITALATLLATLSIGTALAGECASAPMRSDNGNYNGCEVVHGAEVLFRDADDVPEAACAKMCDALTEMDEMAAESHDLDAKAGFGSLDSK